MDGRGSERGGPEARGRMPRVGGQVLFTAEKKEPGFGRALSFLSAAKRMRACAEGAQDNQYLSENGPQARTWSPAVGGHDNPFHALNGPKDRT